MRRICVTLAITALLAAGCGGDDDDSGDSGPARTVAAGSDLKVTATEYAFDPSKVVMKGAGPLRIQLRNDGSLAHNLRVFKGGEELGGTPTFAGGQTEGGTVNLEHGNYELICTVGDHAELGMEGTLEVR